MMFARYTSHLFFLLFTLCICVPLHASSTNISAAEANRRFQLKRDFILFIAGWERKHIRYHASRSFNKQSSVLILYGEDDSILARGPAKEKKPGSFVLYGLWTRYYEDGSLLGRINYKDGWRHGTATGYYKNGKTAQRSHYNYGDYEGTRKRYDSQGRLLDEVTFSGGNAVEYSIHRALVPSFQRPAYLPASTIFNSNYEVWIHRDEENNFITMWYLNGSLLCELNGLHVGKETEVLHGKAVYWYKSGSRWMEGTYSHGTPEIDSWKFYSKDGSPRTQKNTDKKFIFAQGLKKYR